MHLMPVLCSLFRTVQHAASSSSRQATEGTCGGLRRIDVYTGDYPNPEPNPPGVANRIAAAVEMAGYQQLVRGEPFRGKFR